MIFDNLLHINQGIGKHDTPEPLEDDQGFPSEIETVEVSERDHFCCYKAIMTSNAE